MRRFEEALSAWTERRLTQEEAAELLGVCPRSFRRYVDRYHEEGLEGLADKRMSQVSSRSAPVDEVVRLEALYRERYAGWSVAHFHERYREKHGGERSYTWTKNRLQAAGLASKGRTKGRHRKRRERSPMAGLLVHQDGSTHRWAGEAAWDLIVTLDDATTEVYSGFFVDEEDTWSSLRGVRETVERRGLFGSLWTDRGSHYWRTPKAGGGVDKSNPTQFGRAMRELGIEMIPSYSPAGAGAFGAPVRDSAGAAAEGAGGGGRARHGGGEPVPGAGVLAVVEPALRGAGGAVRGRLRSGAGRGSGRHPVPQGGAQGGQRQLRAVQEPAPADPAGGRTAGTT